MLVIQRRLFVSATLFVAFLTGSTSAQEAMAGNATEPNGTRGLIRGGVDRKLATCGNGNRGDGSCANGQCCSQFGWCGTTTAHCGQTGTCGNGNRGNGVCANGQCCSQFGWCGTTSAHCSTTPPATGGSLGDWVSCSSSSQCKNGCCSKKYSNDGQLKCTPLTGGFDAAICVASTPAAAPVSTPAAAPVPTPGGTFGIGSPSRTLTTSDLQAGIDTYNRLQGGSQRATQALVDDINKVTKSYGLYRQLALVAQTIWESGAYQFREEIAATTSPFSTRNNYQDCDWNAGGTQSPANGKLFYGRGYIQLSWCANYLAYGAARMVNGDKDYFYKNPELVATTYAMDSSAWFFENRVSDNSGQFGLTTKSINGGIECVPGYTGGAPQKRYEIFDALAKKVGLTGYSSAGC